LLLALPRAAALGQWLPLAWMAALLLGALLLLRRTQVKGFYEPLGLGLGALLLLALPRAAALGQWLPLAWMAALLLGALLLLRR
ncbi:hypothetical protein, partial [Hymenobacter coccineus]|uniref:hypothetical protein n=1 Tax=Hymenobacter coccineus TaxID=1908235 RepID=UPI001955B505